MVTRFFLVWLVVAGLVFGFTYFVSRGGKRFAIGWGLKVVGSFVLAAILLAIVMVINNISGV